MATGLDMYRAVKKAAERLPAGAALTISSGDRQDLCKLTSENLIAIGFDEKTASAIQADLANGRLEQMGKALGVILLSRERVLNLIPGEGIKRAAALLKDDPQTLEEMLEEFDAMRHPERHPERFARK